MTARTESRLRSRSESNGVPTAAAPSFGRTRDLPTRPRRYAQWAGTLAFLLLCLAAAGWLWQQKGDQVEVLVAGTAVPAGQVIDRGDLAVRPVSGVDGAIAAADLEQVVGRVAEVALVPGQILTDAMITSDQVPADSERVVGLQLDPARTPAGLSPGDAVSVLAVPPSGDPSSPDALASPKVLTESATVHLIDRVEGGGARLSLIVSSDDANRVAAFGAAGRVAIVQLPLGGQD